MADPDNIFDLLEKFRAELMRNEAAASLRLAKAYGRIYQNLLPMIDALVADIAAMEEPKIWKVQRLESLKRLKADIEKQIQDYSAIVKNEISEGAQLAAANGINQAKAATQMALPGIAPIDDMIMKSWNTLRPDAIAAMVGFSAEDGPLFKYLTDKWSSDAAQKVIDAITESVALGRGPKQTAAIIRKTMGADLTDALRITRTTQLYAHREASRASYIANDWLVQGWIWRCSRGSNVCIGCIAMDGTKHTNDERLNDHYNGHCAMEPWLFTYQELGINVDLPPIERQNAKEWFGGLSEAEQRGIMGKAMHAAWKDGKVAIEDMVRETDDKIFGKMRTAESLKGMLDDEAGTYYRRAK